MGIIITIIRRIILDPKFEALAIIGLTNFISKKIMSEKTQEENIQKAQPLFLPKGTIRAILTIILFLTSIANCIWEIGLPVEFHALTIFAVGYYIGYRTDNQINEIKI